MTRAITPILEPGKIYRTRDLAAWSANPARLAKRLVRIGQLMPLARGLFIRPTKSRFGPVPATDEELVRAFLDGAPFVFTGPERWNPLGLGTTAVFAQSLVYNTKRSGLIRLGRRSFLLRRVAFPEKPSKEWYAVDLLEHSFQVGVDLNDLVVALGRALDRGDFKKGLLADMLQRYASKATRALVESLLHG